MKTDILKKIEIIIQLPFENETFQSGAVCFANSEELRSDYKLYFSTSDVVNYVYGVLSQLYPNENLKSVIDLEIPFPTSANLFWKYVEIGKKLRQFNSIEEEEFINFSNLNWQL